MSTYYDILQIPPQADTAAIQTAFTSRYSEVMSLVNHHDPGIANQAQQLMRALEQARDTLTNPATRQSYDAGLGLNRVLGGLVDPTIPVKTVNTAAVTQVRPMAPPPPKPQHNGNTTNGASNTANSASNTAENIWACSKCRNINDPHTRHCRSCRNLLLDVCPNCKQIELLTRTNNCGYCGLELKEGQQKEAYRQYLVKQIETIWAQQDKLREKITKIQDATNIPGAISSLALLISVAAFIYGIKTGFFISAVVFFVFSVMGIIVECLRPIRVKIKLKQVNNLDADIEKIHYHLSTVVDKELIDNKNFMKKTYSQEVLQRLFKSFQN
jgi:hypothetical protein